MIRSLILFPFSVCADCRVQCRVAEFYAGTMPMQQISRARIPPKLKNRERREIEGLEILVLPTVNQFTYCYNLTSIYVPGASKNIPTNRPKVTLAYNCVWASISL